MLSRLLVAPMSNPSFAVDKLIDFLIFAQVVYSYTVIIKKNTTIVVYFIYII